MKSLLLSYFTDYVANIKSLLQISNKNTFIFYESLDNIHIFANITKPKSCISEHYCPPIQLFFSCIWN